MTDEEISTETKKTLHNTKALMWIAIVLLLIISVFLIVLEVQVQTRNSDIKKVKAVVTQAADSSDRAEKAINDAIASSRASSSTNRQFVSEIHEGLDAIKRIEEKLKEMENK